MGRRIYLCTSSRNGKLTRCLPPPTNLPTDFPVLRRREETDYTEPVPFLLRKTVKSARKLPPTGLMATVTRKFKFSKAGLLNKRPALLNLNLRVQDHIVQCRVKAIIVYSLYFKSTDDISTHLIKIQTVF